MDCSACVDIYQSLRMDVIWPLVILGVAGHAVLYLAHIVNGRVDRWQASMAGIVGLMAGVVTITIANNWSGSEAYWLAFTVGLAFVALVLSAGLVMQILEAGSDAR